MAKRPKAAVAANPQKVPRYRNEPDIHGAGPLCWRFANCDIGGPFSWSSIAPEDAIRVVTCLTDFETRNWTGIEETGSHEIETHRLEKPARDRLVDIGHDDQDVLMSFRITAKCRLWCIKDGAMMRVLWWDPEHAVYLVPKDRGDRKKRHRRRK